MLQKKIVAVLSVLIALIVSLLVNIVTGGTLIPFGLAWFLLILFAVMAALLAVVSITLQDSNTGQSSAVKQASNTFASSKTQPLSFTRGSRRSFLQGLFTSVSLLAGGTGLVIMGRFLFSTLIFSGSEPRPKNLLFTYKGHSDSVYGVAWSPDGTRIASSSADSTVQVWHARANPSRIYTFEVDSDTVFAAPWSPDEKYIALGGVNSKENAEIWLIDAQTGHAVSLHPTTDEEIYALTWSPHGKYIALGSMGKSIPWHEAFISVWDSVTFHPLYHKKVDETLLLPSAIYTVAWSPDESRIAFGGTNQIVTVCNAVTGKEEATYEEHSDVIEALAWSPNGKYMASGSKDRTVQIWSATTEIQLSVYREHSDTIQAVSWSPNSKYVASGSRDKTVRVWDAATGTTACVYQGHTGIVYTVAWSPDGTLIASAGEDKTVQVWKPF